MSRRQLTTLVFLIVVTSQPQSAQAQTSRPSSMPATGQSSEERLRSLEQEVRDLRASVSSPASRPSGPISNFSEGRSRAGAQPQLTLSGYVEFFYQWNFNEPDNGITAYRGFDNRHNSLTIANAVLDASGSVGPVSAHVALQVGHTPESYYLAEPVSTGANGVGRSDATVWKLIQQANAGWRAPLGRGLLLEGGIFLSPIGPEGMAVKDQWNWSRSTLFFGLPFYHVGIRLTYPVTDHLNVTLAMYNGWNCIVDNNPEKSIAAQVTYAITDKLTYQLLYFTGVERPHGAPEGRPWRHLFDTYLVWYPTRSLSLLAHGDAGFERNVFGTSWWSAGAVYGRLRLLTWLYLAARGDLFYENAAVSGSRSASPIFWTASWVNSATLTAEARPHENVSFRIEYRHDRASNAMYFENDVQKDTAGAFLPNASSQDTITLGMTAWFQH